MVINGACTQQCSNIRRKSVTECQAGQAAAGLGPCLNRHVSTHSGRGRGRASHRLHQDLWVCACPSPTVHSPTVLACCLNWNFVFISIIPVVFWQWQTLLGKLVSGLILQSLWIWWLSDKTHHDLHTEIQWQGPVPAGDHLSWTWRSDGDHQTSPSTQWLATGHYLDIHWQQWPC